MTAIQDSRLAGLTVDGVLAALGLPASGQENGLPYAVIQGNHGPRWMLPQRSRLTNAILGEWRPYGLFTHFCWRGVRLAARCGALAYLPGTAQARLPRDAGKRILERAGFAGDAEAPLILVGNTESTRKLLVFLAAGARGNIVIKVPLGPLARASLSHEAKVLAGLDGGFGAPRLLDFRLDTGAALTEYLPGRLGSRRLKPEYLQLLIDMARRGEVVTLRGRATILRERLGRHAGYGQARGTVEQTLARLENGAELPAALVHGDFAPWNLRHRADGGCGLIDWEQAEWAGMPMHDLCHFFCMQAKLFAPRTFFAETLEREGSWRRYLAALRIPETLLRPLEAAFLLESLERAWAWGPEESAGFFLGQMERLLGAGG
jgi:hypothetical protein